MGPRPACGERAARWFRGKEWVRGNSAGERPSPITVCGTAREPSPRKRGEGSFGAGAHLRSRSTELELTGGEIAGLPTSAFFDARELGRMLAESPVCQECMVRQIFRYAYGRLETNSD